MTNYKIDIEAHDGLNRLFAQPSDSTLWKHKQQYLFTDTQVAPAFASRPTRQEGVSHHLNMISVFLSEWPELWIDNRPQAIIREHNMQLNRPQPTSYREAKADPLGSIKYEVSWTTPVDTHVRLAQEYRFQDHTRDYLYKLAKLHKMAPLSRHTGQTAYISACLEAIGIGYLAPPVGYEYILLLPNGAKARDTTGRSSHKLYGNPSHTPIMIKPIVPITIASLKAQGLWEDD